MTMKNWIQFLSSYLSKTLHVMVQLIMHVECDIMLSVTCTEWRLIGSNKTTLTTQTAQTTTTATKIRKLGVGSRMRYLNYIRLKLGLGLPPVHC